MRNGAQTADKARLCFLLPCLLFIWPPLGKNVLFQFDLAFTYPSPVLCICHSFITKLTPATFSRRLQCEGIRNARQSTGGDTVDPGGELFPGGDGEGDLWPHRVGHQASSQVSHEHEGPRRRGLMGGVVTFQALGQPQALGSQHLLCVHLQDHHVFDPGKWLFVTPIHLCRFPVWQLWLAIGVRVPLESEFSAGLPQQNRVEPDGRSWTQLGIIVLL